MQYDENAERYGYEGEMMPLKCDELKIYVAPTPDGTGLADYCLKSEVDEAIAELKDVIHELQVDLEGAKVTAYAESVDAGMRERRLKRALWLARAYRAKAIYTYWHVKCIEGHLLYEHKWIVVERKCRAKAEEYK